MGQWRVEIVETTTGQIMAEPEPAELPRFLRERSAKGSWSVSLATAARANRRIDLHSFSTSARYCWAVSHDGMLQQAGPVTGWSWNDEARSLTVSGAGIGALFDDRVVKNPAGDPAKMAAAENTATYSNMTLGTIMCWLLANGLQPAGYDLPVRTQYPLPSGTATRTYYGYDLATVWERVTELSEVDGGPEFLFVPHYVSGQRKIAWDLRIGSPLLGDQNTNAVWDYGGALGAINEEGNATTGPISRAFAKGAGQDHSTLIGYATDPTVTTRGFPGRDHVDTSHSSVEKADTIAAHARAGLAERAAPRAQWSATVRLDGRSTNGTKIAPALGEYDVGDAPLIRIPAGHPWLRERRYRKRIRSISEGTADTVTLGLDDTPVTL